MTISRLRIRTLNPWLWLLLSALLLPLAARAADFALPDWQGSAPLRLPAPALSIDYLTPPMAPDSIESLMVVKPRDAIEHWARQRLRPEGGRYRAELTVAHANIASEQMATSGGIQGWFKREQAERYTLRIEVSLALDDGAGNSATVAARVQESGTLGEHPSEAERQTLWHQLLVGALQSLDSEMQTRARTEFPSLIR